MKITGGPKARFTGSKATSKRRTKRGRRLTRLRNSFPRLGHTSSTAIVAPCCARLLMRPPRDHRERLKTKATSRKPGNRRDVPRNSAETSGVGGANDRGGEKRTRRAP